MARKKAIPVELKTLETQVIPEEPKEEIKWVKVSTATREKILSQYR